MITVIMNCKKCGRPIEVQFESEERAKKCTNKRCDKCKQETVRLAKERSKEERRARSYVAEDIDNKKVNQACDNFFRKRGIKNEGMDKGVLSESAKELRRASAEQYGEQAARRYMRGAKDGN